MTHLEVPDVGSFPSVFVQAALKHHSVCIEFESETEVKDIKINHHNIVTGLQGGFLCFLFSGVFVTLNVTQKKTERQSCLLEMGRE